MVIRLIPTYPGEKESYNKFIKMQRKYPYPPIAQLAKDSHAAEWLQQIETNIQTLADWWQQLQCLLVSPATLKDKSH